MSLPFGVSHVLKVSLLFSLPRRTLSYPADVKAVATPALRLVQGGEAAFASYHLDSDYCEWSGAGNVPMLD